MKKQLVLFGFLLIFGCSGNQSNTNAVESADGQTIVDVAVDSLLLNAKNYENRVVRVSGIVEHVCVHTGLRITLQGKSPEMKLSVKTSDASRPFDMSMKGAKAIVTGVFKRVEKANGICEAESVHHPGEIYFLECNNINVK
jgi:hypothetical protein